jgi:hypothetical protein
MFSTRWISAVFLALAIVAGAGWLLQREATSALRTEMMLLREDNRKLDRLRAEHERLAAKGVSDVELERLRADHAAVMRLREEIETLRTRAEKMERDAAVPVSATPAKPVAVAAPTRTLRYAITREGTLSFEGNPVDLAMIRQQLAALPRGERVAIRLELPRNGPAGSFAQVKQAVDGIMGVVKEMGIKMELQLDRTAN